MPQQIQWPQIAAFRLARQHLAPGRPNTGEPASICLGACGIQAQVMSAAEMGLWTRDHSLTQQEIQEALWIGRSLVKTSAMRGTLHLLPSSEFTVYMRALKKSRLRQMRQVMTRYGVSPKVSDRVTEAVLKALSDGPLTRPELTQRILALDFVKGKAKGWFQQSWWGVTRQAMIEGLVCYGPNQGRSVTLALTEQWLPEQPKVEEGEAQRDLFCRYLSCYGPASPQDFSKWAGVRVSEARAIRDQLRDELAEVEADSKPGWLLRCDLDALHKDSAGHRNLRLLPYFDGYLLGHADKGSFLEPEHYKRVFRQAGWVTPVVLLNGKVIGLWSLTHRSNHSIVEVEPLIRVSKAIRRLIGKEIGSLGIFLGNTTQTVFKA